MVSKARIIDVLGEHALLLPEAVNRGLAANDRVKYYLTLLQSAKLHADDPGAAASDLESERLASGVADDELDDVVAASRRVDGGYHIPHAARLHELIIDGVEEMLAPVESAAGNGGAPPGNGFHERLAHLRSGPAPGDGDLVPGDYVDAVSRAQRRRGDSVHLLVMDLHKALNRLQESLAVESIDGARVYGIEDDDRALVRAFMNGLNRTAPLKFDHPGLGTTATRSGDALVIQNDIGTTDAHVLVVRVRGLQVVVTYTDIHDRRARFFESLFDSRGTVWDDTRSRRASGLEESDSYLLCTGRFEARDRADLEDYLAFLGSRIVFLIDWNKARKRLRGLTRMRDAIEVLKWAADSDVGHRAFLELGGERLVFDAIEQTTSAPVRYGERLDRILGRDAVRDFLRFVLRTCTEGLLEGRAARSVRDEVKADLLERFHTTEQSFFGLIGDHAALTVDLAGAVRDGLAHATLPGAAQELERTARRAKHWETRADALLVSIRERLEHAPDRDYYERLSHEADDVADHLEEAAMLMPLLPAVETPETFTAPLVDLAAQVLEGSRGFVSALEAALHVERGGAREDLRDFLASVERILGVEHATDEMDRELEALLIRGGAEHRQLHLASLIGKRLEKAADSLARSALMLRDRVMSGVTTR